jgi:hypothetical protein
MVYLLMALCLLLVYLLMVAVSNQVIIKKCQRQLALVISEESILARQDKVRGFAAINQLQTLHVYTKSALNLNHHDRLYCQGASNRGNVLGPLALDAHDDSSCTWILKVKDKFSLCGRHGPRIPVGGSADDSIADDAFTPAKEGHKPRDKDVIIYMFP